MKVYCYYTPCQFIKDAKWVLDRWVDEWSKAGWEPVVLTHADARKHPKFPALSEVFAQNQSVNDPGYEQACRIRWIAMAMLGGFHTDFDLFPNGIRPSYIQSHLIAGPGPYFFDRSRVPCAVAATIAGYEKMLQWMRDFVPDVHHTINNRTHVSDQTVMNAHTEAYTLDVVREYGETRPGGLMTHFSNDSSKGNKRAAIESVFGK